MEHAAHPKIPKNTKAKTETKEQKKREINISNLLKDFKYYSKNKNDKQEKPVLNAAEQQIISSINNLTLKVECSI